MRLLSLRLVLLGSLLLSPLVARAGAAGAIDLSSLPEEKRALYQDIISERLSPCGEAETLEACLQKEDGCLACIARGRTIARLLQKTSSRERIEKILDEIDAAQAAKPVEIDLEGVPWRGGKDAPVILVEFADFECSYCGSLEPTLQRLIARYPERVRQYFINFPLTGLHPFAEPAARAAIAAGKQGKFWEYHDLLYERQDRFDADVFVKWAEELGLDPERFRQDMDSKETKDKLAADIAQARRLGVNSTPTLYINGKRYEDASTEEALEDAITYAYADTTGQSSIFLRDPARRARAEERTLYAHLLQLLDFALNAAFLWLFVAMGWSARLSARARKIFSGPWGHTFLFLLLFTLLDALLFLPWSILKGWWFDTRYDLSNQTLGEWFLDWGKGFGLSLVFTALLGSLFYFAVRKFPRRWWLVVAFAVVPLMVFFALLFPVVVAPLFHEYTPLPEGPVRTRIETMATEHNIPLEGIYQMDMSRQTSRANAYVSGLGATKRIVFTDTLLENFTPDEIAFVSGHEIGHYVLHHIWLQVLLSGAGGFVLLFLLSRLSQKWIARHRERFGFSEVSDPASYPLLGLVAALLLFIAGPAGAGVSRVLEHQADVYGLTITGSGEAAAAAFEKLGDQNLSDPDPPVIFKYLFYDHPTLKERIDFARAWTSPEMPQE